MVGCGRWDCEIYPVQRFWHSELAARHTIAAGGCWGSERRMRDSGNLVLQVCPAPGDDAEELAELSGWLRSELLDLDVEGVDRLPDEDVPAGAKGVAAIAGWLMVQLGPTALRVVLTKVADWVTRNDRVVEVSYGDDTLKLRRATREQQEKIIDGWLARHPAGS
jgi:hypothetical protein